MLRRLSIRPVFAQRYVVAGYFTLSPVRFQGADSSGSEAPADSNAKHDTNTSGSASRWRRLSASQLRARRPQLPPAFDVVHWNDDDMSSGHLLRVLHRDSFVVLDYHRQVKKLGEEGNKAERVVSVMLPAVYTARFLGVLEGRLDKVEVQSRFTNAVFAPDPAVPHTFILNCTSTRPPQQQQQQNGGNGEEEKFDWTVKFDVAESLMLHRFLTQALHYNTGFARTLV
ncbi:putative mitochondrial RNA-binding protein 2 [Trypanosoma cruzi]|uniref:Mitochondrial RNA-binding protein 2, putative n=2 Tax=Trypanosoma cruzi TaxID=5693 RepID=Q4DWJ0_TRYCC|nr:mitochondrial RNA-binding protein 2, putative [Trypanosoma cruzi]EAN96915.1 mitochondrial RNA-binding protein 2, putative [Trypanosoma cruzi]PWV09736.1 putative mitochondrial RNA-binding protein 2 [Trypanosoma cruzi]RNC50788.1 mitochondrial RNA-binding protein 2 [Trypanosoma cruzi]|eukprot:XP_818766.1 mitochondrial RNA-binding protein 2 [Trypanosoma cruzi strain CL Brener]